MAVIINTPEPDVNLLNEMAKESWERRRMTGPNDFPHSKEKLDEMWKAHVGRSAIISLPHADNIEELTKNRTAPKPSNEEIALRLVEAWCRQDGYPASFNGVVDNYFEVLKKLEEESKDA